MEGRMVASSIRSIWDNRSSAWKLPLDHPIEVERGGRLATLGDVGVFILALPDALKAHQSWKDAAEAVVAALSSRDTAPVTLAVYMALILTGERTEPLGLNRTRKRETPYQSLASLTRDLAVARRDLQAITRSATMRQASSSNGGAHAVAQLHHSSRQHDSVAAPGIALSPDGPDFRS